MNDPENGWWNIDRIKEKFSIGLIRDKYLEGLSRF